jgi:hypothetical protein
LGHATFQNQAVLIYFESILKKISTKTGNALPVFGPKTALFGVILELKFKKAA